MPQQFTVEYQKSRRNLIFNPSFESNTVTGTGSECTLSVINTGAYSGTYALQVVASAGSTSAAHYVTPANQSLCTPNKTYTGSVYVKNTSGATRIMQVNMQSYDASNNVINAANGTGVSVTAGGGYQRLSVSMTPESGSAYIRLFVYHQLTNSAVNNTAVIDGFLLEESASADTYFDGSSSGASWTGTISNSVSVLPTTTWVTLDNVQQISGFIGRQQLADTFEPSRMSISARYPTGFSTPNSALVVDTQVRVKRTGSLYTMWTGRIRNVTVQWEIPYKTTTGIGVSDTVNIECEGALAQWGRLQGNGLLVSASDLLTQLSNVLSGTNLNYGTTYTAATAPQLSASEVSDSLASWLNTACATVGATIKDGSDSNIVGVNGRDFAGNLPVQFSDTTNNATNQVFDTITFDSVSADFFTQIELNTYSYGDVQVNYGIAPYRTLRQTTYSASLPQATDLSNYLLGIFGDNGFGISEISCKSEAQNSWALDLGYGWWDIIGYTTFVTFRSQTFRCTIVGAAFTATPSESRFTYYLADIGLTPFLILDDTSAGILDQNKLGW